MLQGINISAPPPPPPWGAKNQSWQEDAGEVLGLSLEAWSSIHQSQPRHGAIRSDQVKERGLDTCPIKGRGGGRSRDRSADLESCPSSSLPELAPKALHHFVDFPCNLHLNLILRKLCLTFCVGFSPPFLMLLIAVFQWALYIFSSQFCIRKKQKTAVNKMCDIKT